jgi:P27 family predicted phage terminase small subunit
MAPTGILTTLDGTALAAYCQAFSRWVDAEAKARKLGPIIKSPSGYPMLNPYVTLAKTAFDQMTKYLIEFGMTPAARSRVASGLGQNNAEKRVDSTDEFFSDPRSDYPVQ